MGKFINNNREIVVIVIGMVIAGAVAWGVLKTKVSGVEAIAADNKIKIEVAITDVAVEKEKVKRLEKNQEQYSSDVKAISVSLTGQLVETKHIKQDIQEIKELLKELAAR